MDGKSNHLSTNITLERRNKNIKLKDETEEDETSTEELKRYITNLFISMVVHHSHLNYQY